MKTAKLFEEIAGWLRQRVLDSGGNGVVFGLSGGLDSAVVAALSQKAFGDNSLGLIMPCYSEKIETEHGLLVARQFDLPHKIVSLNPVFDAMLLAVRGSRALPGEKDAATINIKPRLRMATLYFFAAGRGYRVLGTSNKSELFTGYFTKYGDSGVDLEPIGSLLKEEVHALALYAGVPQAILDKKPTAGLWEGQTDEEEMGFSYEQLDGYLKGERVSLPLRERIEKLNRSSEHKRQLPPIFQKKV